MIAAPLAAIVLLLSSCDTTTVPKEKIIEPELPKNTMVIRDFPYGSDPRQKIDIYAPKNSKNAPVIMMLYGAGYYEGNKSEPILYINKLNRWGPKGFIVISVSTRNLPKHDAYTQIQDLALAVTSVQKNMKQWGGGDPTQLFLMGFSSGGHLVSLLSSKPSLVTNLGGQKWLGTLALDSSTMDVPFSMNRWHPDFFSKAYGENEEKWKPISPIHQLNHNSIPMFASCALQLKYNRCGDFKAFAKHANQFNVDVDVYPVDTDHGGANSLLGLDNAYTATAEKFMASQSPAIAALLH